jgi:alkylhydroperoxidase/carboxymuconolactone decarboxylase family protein YurZ
MSDDTDSPVMDTLAAMTAASLENSNLDDRELMLVRTAALVATGAPAASYLMNIGPASDAGITLEDVQNVLVAVAPIVGTTRVVSATANIAKALGFVILAAAELEAEIEAEEGAGDD